ncbi:MAG: beta strand repeat-containing protein [Chlorobium sp.]
MANISYTLNGTGNPDSANIASMSGQPSSKNVYTYTFHGLAGDDTFYVAGENAQTGQYSSNFSAAKFSIGNTKLNNPLPLGTVPNGDGLNAGMYVVSGASNGGTSFTFVLDSVETLVFRDKVVTLSYSDTTAPTLSSSSPADAASGVAVNSSIVLTFSEAVQKGTGLIEIHTGSATGAVVESYDAATSTNLSFSGSTLTINPTADLANSTTYFVTVASGAVKDLANNSYLGITTYDFTTVADTTPPTVTTFSPADAATGVAVNSSIVLTFSEVIQRGAGLIEIYAGSVTGTPIATYDAANSSNLMFSGKTLTINPSADLASDGSHYFVTLASGTVKDLAVNPNLYAGTTTYDFFTLDTTAPTVTTFSPADAATGVTVGSDIVLTFSEAILKGTGAIAIRAGSAAGTPVATYDAANSTNLKFIGNTLTINPTADLANDGTQYFVTLGSGTVTDVAGNPYAGTTTYDFFTIDTVPPTVSTFSPVDAATGIPVGSDIVLTFSETIQKGTGSIAIRAGSATASPLETYDTASNTPNLTFIGKTLTINPTITLANGIQYFVTLASGSVKDSTGNSYLGTITYDFTTTATVDITPPTLSTSAPPDAETGVAVNSDIVLTFSEFVQKGSGTIEIRRDSANGTSVAAYDAATSNSNLIFSGNTLTINPSADLSNSTQYFVIVGSDAVRDLSNNSYSGINTYDFTTVADKIPPTVTSVSPASAATGVPVGSDIVLTFSEAIQRGTGLIEIHAGSATGTPVVTYDAANSTNLTYYSNTLTINPTVDLASDGTHYFVTMASGTVKDIAGNSYTGNLYPGATTYDFFTPDTTPPTVTTFSPTDAATGVAVGGDIVLTFSEKILKGAGAIEIHSGSATGTTVASYEAANSPNLTFSGETLTINPTADMASDGTQYFITLAPGTLYDLAGNLYAGTTTYNFFTLDTTSPTVTAFSPAAAATGVAVGSNIMLTFNETIQRGAGAIAIHAGSTGTVVATYEAATSSNLAFSGNTLTIDPTADLATDTHYVVTLVADSVKDVAGNGYTGTTSYDFTTVDTIAPTVTSSSPTDAATGVPVGSDIVITFSEAVHSGTGLIEIHSGSETGAVVASYESATNTSNLSFLGNMLTINPTDNLAADTHFFVTLQNGSVNDLAGNYYAGTTGYDFTTGADPYAGGGGNIGVDAGPVVVGVAGLGVLAWVLFF